MRFYFDDLRADCYVDCDGGEIGYFPYNIVDNMYSLSLLLNPNDPTQGDNRYDYLIFSNYSEYSNFHWCLDADEMNWYYESMEDLIESGQSTDDIANIEVGWLLGLGDPYRINHAMVAIYGDAVPVAIGDDVPESLPEP